MAREINLNHICKVEGHANLSLKIENNRVEKCELKAVEGARFFEALVVGKKVKDVQEIVSRICGICSSAHSVACIQALEEAMGIKASRQQEIIRELLMIGERIRSHATHLYFLVLPDYYNISSALQLSEKNQDKIDDAVSLISLGNKIIEIVGGREIHPFLGIQDSIKKSIKENISRKIEEIEKKKEVIEKTINLFLSLKYPKLERKTDYLSLYNSENYATISGKIKSQSGMIIDDDYKKHLQENIREYATSKFALKDKKPYMVGAMARINNSYNQLDKETKKFLKTIKLPFNNPFQNNIAQAIELLHLANRAIKISSELETDEPEEIKIKDGRGISAVEAPRGTLFHEYVIDKEGKISYCNIITPTVQNLNMMEQDIKMLVNFLLAKKSNKEKIVLEIEKLIRAYDPCFSCSTHFLKVNWE
ncbi:Ni/Fe hydrogenase subunit alpha [Candidatus Pacearchaeota archaeon]|nr:Ni/Fe hydrogenase subunit alpha [Candidatus Pacearchaeota archaeon]